jgi:hypothetical protein
MNSSWIIDRLIELACLTTIIVWTIYGLYGFGGFEGIVSP